MMKEAEMKQDLNPDINNTGIEEVTGEDVNTNTIYDLQGRKIENPTKGIYIINGKKVFVK